MRLRMTCDVCSIEGTITFLGEDCAVTIEGGSHPHIGTVIMATPRPSLTGNGTSSTLSVINRTGHYDDVLLGDVAKRLSSRLGCVVSCTGGIHIDEANKEDIDLLSTMGEDIANEIIRTIEETRESHG